MTNRTTTISLGAIWEETAAFLKAEWSLLLPVAFLGFGVPMVMMLLAVPSDAATTGQVKPGLWMLWFLPSGLFMMTGSLAVSAMTLRAGASVRECLMLALQRMPSGIGLFLLNIGVQVALAIPLSAIGLIETRLSGGVGAASAVGNLAVLAVMIWLFVRVLPIWALLADRAAPPLPTVRESFRITHGHYPKLLVLRVVGACAGMLVLVVLLVPIAALLTLIGKLAQADEALEILSFVAFGALFGSLAGAWTVYVARLYRRLAELSGTGG